ncbi:amino acid permease [Haloechinothrix sp. YIM 98757]|uniref:Amino acid permease n=1 Tax=Haloechinothrix aidingensis TaxID=2752311 RepID=A0A838A7K2_9PSEU|nr:amino acid permease [Haloechinothrix aidingensis]MBA0124321.1 amino acid permease [Haloechinothrix aidingensis]
MSSTTTEHQSAPDRARLSRWQAVPLAVGSVAGSGILFLPSAVYAEVGRNSLLVWALATVLCLPMLLMFRDMVRLYPTGDGIEAFISAGLGVALGRCVPILFVALVVVGLPGGALVAGRYAMRALGAGPGVQIATAAGVLLAAVAVNAAGARANTRAQRASAAALVVMAVVLVCSAIPIADGASPIAPQVETLGLVVPGVLLAFWAFAGFENLTFLSRQFRAPDRDFLPVSVIALSIYGLLTVLLTAAIAVSVPAPAVDGITGLLQLAEHLRPRQLVVAVVTAIAVGAMVLNAVSWIWGVSQLVVGASRSAILPAALATTTGRGVPRRALGLLTVLFLVVGTVLAVFPALLVDALAATSATFVVLYLLSIASYVRLRGPTLQSVLNLLVGVVLTASLTESGWRSLYCIAVLAAALTVSLLQGRRHR